MSSKGGQYNIIFDSCEKNRSVPLKYMFPTAVLLAIIVAGVCLLITRIVEILYSRTRMLRTLDRLKLSRDLERLLGRYDLLTKYVLFLDTKVFNRI